MLKFKFLIFSFLLTSLSYADQIGMMTGSSSGTYIKMGRDISSIVSSKHNDINIWVRSSAGSIENVKLLNSKENAAFAIVQSDVLDYLKTTPSMIKNISKVRSIFPLYNEEVHVLANKKYKTLFDLKGKKIFIGTPGSGTYLTSINILKNYLKIDFDVVRSNISEAYLELIKGNIDAVFFVGGKPIGYLDKIIKIHEEGGAYSKSVEDLHLIPIEDDRLKKTYSITSIKTSDYTNGTFSLVDKEIKTIAVKAILVSYDFSNKKSSYFKRRCEQIERIRQTIHDEINNLKENSKSQFHKKWNDVNLNAEHPIKQIECPIKTTTQDDLYKNISCILNNDSAECEVNK